MLHLDERWRLPARRSMAATASRCRPARPARSRPSAHDVRVELSVEARADLLERSPSGQQAPQQLDRSKTGGPSAFSAVDGLELDLVDRAACLSAGSGMLAEQLASSARGCRGCRRSIAARTRSGTAGRPIAASSVVFDLLVGLVVPRAERLDQRRHRGPADLDQALPSPCGSPPASGSCRSSTSASMSAWPCRPRAGRSLNVDRCSGRTKSDELAAGRSG